MYAEQKEEEVKILEHSVEELEFTINVLEKKVSLINISLGIKHNLMKAIFFFYTSIIIHFFSKIGKPNIRKKRFLTYIMLNLASRYVVCACINMAYEHFYICFTFVRLFYLF